VRCAAFASPTGLGNSDEQRPTEGHGPSAEPFWFKQLATVGQALWASLGFCDACPASSA